MNPIFDSLRRFAASALHLTPLAVLASAPELVLPDDGGLPSGVQAVWDVSKAFRESTPTRERICINGLWRWQPADKTAAAVPAGDWGYFKVPGSWPGITSYLQKESQVLYKHPGWKTVSLSGVTAAWYQREIVVPAEWRGRRIEVATEYLNSYAAVFLDGAKAGEVRFPGGAVDITSAARPGAKQVLSMLVLALPLKGVMLSYTDSASAREVKGSVERRGLCGDVFLTGMPSAARLAGVRVDTSVRKWELAIEASVEGVKAGDIFSAVAQVADNGRKLTEFRSTPAKFETGENGRISFTNRWHAEKLWDIHTPQNQYELTLSLLDARGAVVDVLPPFRFGFRELWIDGRDFYLNGSRVFFSALPLDNAAVSTAAATYSAAKESLERLRSLGINFLYTHNYGCEPGSHLSFSEVLRAADDMGMLVALSQPHFSHYDWSAAGADKDNGYAQHAAYYTRVAGNHPSVVMYATSHNATGYNEDMDPDEIDGLYDKRDQWAMNNVKKALRAEAIIKSLDPGRIVYHHASGNLGSMHLSNFYPNFVPVQEMSDWFGHWAGQGVKPLFLCEYGAPFTWDWAMYRGWYKGKREFGSAVAPWEFCLGEWNAQFLGDAAFDVSEMEKRNLRWEARQFRDGKLWHRWDYPHQLGSADFPEREVIFERYYRDNWPAFRTWGVSANSPWEHNILFRLRPGMNRNQRQVLPVDWANLQRPGYSPDYEEDRYERMDLAYARSDWTPTRGAEALMRYNQPLLAYLAGKPSRFTSKDHLFVGGETVEKQLIIINNSRMPVRCECSWSLDVTPPASGKQTVSVETGQQVRLPLRFVLPAGATPRQYKLSAKVRFSNGELQEDEFAFNVLPRRGNPSAGARVALFDPQGETTRLLESMSFRCTPVEANADLEGYDLVIFGKAALSVEGAAPNVSRVRNGLKAVFFEQKSEALEKRLGFRVAEYGLRNVFPRLPDHPVLAGLGAEQLRDWRGEATLLPSKLAFRLNPKFNNAPTVTWCGLDVTRAWRCGCLGNVASVLIEKPACGNFLPLLDGGFSLQYSPLMEYREGKGMVVFCQMDVTGRTEEDPAARTLVANLLDYALRWKPAPSREPVYVGAAAGQAHLEAAGFQPRAYAGGALKADQVLVAGPEAGKALAPYRDEVSAFLKGGGHILALGLGQEDAKGFLPVQVPMKSAEHINACFSPPALTSPFAGVGPADVHSRAARELPLVSGGALSVGDGVLAVTAETNVVFCQLVPWQFDYGKNYGLKRTFRRTSFLVSRLLGNLNVGSGTPLLARCSTPVGKDETGRWLQGLYLDAPEEWDDPYRFFRW